MKKNASYETHRPPIREEVQLQDKAKPTDVRFKLTDTISRSNDDKTNCSTLNKKETNLNAKCIGLVVLFLLAIAAIALSVYARVDSNQGMNSLMQEIQELKMQLNKTNKASEKEITKLKRDLTQIETDGLTTNNANLAQLTSLQFSVNALNLDDNVFRTKLNSLQSSVNSLNTVNSATMTQLNSLQSSVSSLTQRTANSATMTQLNNLRSSVSNIQSSVSSLTTQVNSAVNLHNCIQETESCTIGPRTTDTYWEHCETAFEPISKAVSSFWAQMYNIKYMIINVSVVSIRFCYRWASLESRPIKLITYCMGDSAHTLQITQNMYYERKPLVSYIGNY